MWAGCPRIMHMCRYFDVVWYGVAWHGMAWCGVVWCGRHKLCSTVSVWACCTLEMVLGEQVSVGPDPPPPSAQTHMKIGFTNVSYT